jgi:signal-transduction protein with cAMP-binding, CBS, and nucleotidyltransferase domain
MSYRSKLETLKDQIDKLDVNEHRQIYNIIKRFNTNQIQTTKTQQGILITADTLNKETIDEIERYVHFCLDQRKRMDEDMKTRKEYERMV